MIENIETILQKSRWIILICVFLATCVSEKLYSQWSNDPASNTIIADGGLNFANIKASNDFYYVSYFKYVDGISLPFLSKVDYSGYKKWGIADVLITDIDLPSYPGQYDLQVDSEGNAIIALQNEILNEVNNYISIYKISPSKVFLWGNDGIRFQPPGDIKLEPSICLFPDNSFALMAAAYNENGQAGSFQIWISKYTTDGDQEWENEYVNISSELGAVVPIGLTRGTDNSLIVLYHITFSEDDEVYACKIDQYGEKAWETDRLLSQGGLGMGSKFNYCQGEDGEAYVAWTTYNSPVGNTRVNMRGIYGDGSLLWENHPIIPSDLDQCQNSPTICGPDSKGCMYILWSSCDINPGEKYTLMGQKISPEGELLWDSKGITIAEGNSFSQIATTVADDTIYICYKDPSFHLDIYTSIKLVAIGENGNICWGGPLQINSEETIKARPQISGLISGQGVISFITHDEGPSSFGKVKIQNFWTDGTIGNKSSYIPDNGSRMNNPQILFNPYDKTFNISGCESIQSVSLYSISGQLIDTWEIGNPNESFVQLKCPPLVEGVYFIRLTTNVIAHVSTIYLKYTQ